MSVRQKRLMSEMAKLHSAPPSSHFACWLPSDDMDVLRVDLCGPDDAGCPYRGGVWRLRINFPERYPFAPPLVTFETPIYHPNVDEEGRICHELLRVAPAGRWCPVVSMTSVLTSIYAMLIEPGVDDPLRKEVAQQLRCDRAAFDEEARKSAMDSLAWRKQHGQGREQMVVASEQPLSSIENRGAASAVNEAKSGLKRNSSETLPTDGVYNSKSARLL